MRANGTLQYLKTTPAGHNEYGEPIPAQTSLSKPIRCSIKTNSDNRKGVYEDGVFRQASFSVLLESQTLDEFNRVCLIRDGEDLGEYQVMSREQLKSVGRISILV